MGTFTATKIQGHCARLMLGIGLIGVLAACVSDGASTPPPLQDSASIQAANEDANSDDPTRYPAMWKVSDEDTQIIIFGTFHLLPENVEWVSPAMKAAMEATDVTYFEADTTSLRAQQALQAAILKYGVNPPGVTLTSVLGEFRAARFATVAERYGLSMASLETLRPWLASLQVTLSAYGQLGFAPGAGAETVILDLANAQGDRLAYLETGTDQIAAFAAIEDRDNFSSFDDGLNQLVDPEQQILSLFEAWHTGDVAAIEKEIVNAVRDVSPDAYQILFVDRNTAWTQELKSLLDGEGDYFVAVGAGHLVGEQSVVALLRRGGFQVTRIQ